MYQKFIQLHICIKNKILINTVVKPNPVFINIFVIKSRKLLKNSQSIIQEHGRKNINNSITYMYKK